MYVFSLPYHQYVLVKHPVPDFAILINSTLLGGLSTNFCVLKEVCVYSAMRALMRSGADGQENEVWGVVGVSIHRKDVQWS